MHLFFLLDNFVFVKKPSLANIYVGGETKRFGKKKRKKNRMYALPVRINLPPSKPVTVDIRQELGRGVCGVVIEAFIDGRQCALKLVLSP